ncbi:MAG TPA: sigma-70 family RNA polymerase sigma factor [Bryobacteraceae bacterium]
MTTPYAMAASEICLPSFAEAVEKHKGMVYSIAWHVLHDRLASEELAQDVFLQLHRNWTAIKSPEHMTFWLRKVASHRAIDAARKSKAGRVTSLEEMAEPTVLERMHDAFLASYLKRMVASLPERQRVMVVLRYQEDMEPQEIAKVLDMNVNTVKTQISRALDLLRAKVSDRLGREGRKQDDAL